MILTHLLVHGLALGVGLGSATLYLAAFFFPEVHRRHDFFWSGVGLFYSLVLWFGAGSIDPTELLGHGASVSLLGWLGWQTLTLRRKRTPLALQTPYTSDSWSNLWREIRALLQDFLNQTPLGRWLTRFNQPTPSTLIQDQALGLRASSLKQVGYEFLDDLAKGELPSGRQPLRPGLPPRAAARSGSSQLLVDLRAQPGEATVESSPLSPKNQRQPPLNWGQRWQVLVQWSSDLWRSLITPKPKRAVIEIPPRQPMAEPASQPAISKTEPPADQGSFDP